MAKGRKTSISAKNSLSLFILGILALIIVIGAFALKDSSYFAYQPRASELAQEYDITTKLPSCVQNIRVLDAGITPGVSGGYCKVNITCKGYSKNPYDHSGGWQPILCERRIGVSNQFMCSWDHKNVGGSCPSIDGNEKRGNWVTFASFVCGCGDDSNKMKPLPINPDTY